VHAQAVVVAPVTHLDRVEQVKVSTGDVYGLYLSYTLVALFALFLCLVLYRGDPL
jgi:hypothetical protein